MDTFTVIAEPSRRQILDSLAAGPLAVGEVVNRVGMCQPATSRHLRVLRDAGVVNVERDGQRRLYSINGETMREIDTWLSQYRHLWADRLDALTEHLEKNP